MLQSLINTLFGCSHQRTTFPLTLTRSARNATYVTCLDCGKEFAYDWQTMRMGRVYNVTSPSTTAEPAPVAEGKFAGLPRHVS
jgi:hypothetical protein